MEQEEAEQATLDETLDNISQVRLNLLQFLVLPHGGATCWLGLQIRLY